MIRASSPGRYRAGQARHALRQPLKNTLQLAAKDLQRAVAELTGTAAGRGAGGGGGGGADGGEQSGSDDGVGESAGAVTRAAGSLYSPHIGNAGSESTNQIKTGGGPSFEQVGACLWHLWL